MSAVGFSYTYLTSDNLKLQQAVVTNGTLAAEGPAIKALVVPGKSSITEDVIDNLIQYANAGLPIVVAGSLSIYPSAHAPSKEEQEQAISRLRVTSNVIQQRRAGWRPSCSHSEFRRV
jgi:hypothetical protein